MIRRSLTVAVGLVLAGGLGSQALADPVAPIVKSTTADGQHALCILGQDTPNGAREGICVWIPTK